MLDDTLVIWGGEFGRTPTVELPTPGSNQGKMNGRDHNHYGFTMWLAGGGVKGGHVHGATDEFGFQAVENKVHVHDLHATMLHLLGFDHERFTYRYAGRDFRLTDVHGKRRQGNLGVMRGKMPAFLKLIAAATTKNQSPQTIWSRPATTRRSRSYVWIPE